VDECFEALGTIRFFGWGFGSWSIEARTVRVAGVIGRVGGPGALVLDVALIANRVNDQGHRSCGGASSAHFRAF
jgi:hypothetical protein